MIFNTHLDVAGKHAYLSASKYQWINYDEDKFDRVYMAALAAKKGTELHALAHDLIRHNVKVEDTTQTFNSYVNDAIGYKMTPEQILMYSYNSYGTADAISFRNNLLRIHDLKTGVNPASEHQLEVYAALFCLEYKFRPFEIDMELRLYQNDAIERFVPDPDDIFHIMDRIVTFDKRIETMKKEVLL